MKPSNDGRVLTDDLKAVSLSAPLLRLRHALPLRAAIWVVALCPRFENLRAEAECVLVEEAARLLRERSASPPAASAPPSGGRS
jgi:hypothetical protein